MSSILITGGSSGLGYAAALNLATAAESIKTHMYQQNTSYLHLDLSSLSSIRSFVETWKKGKYPPIRHLLLNAGIQTSDPIQYTNDGFERTFAVNHLGHALLFHLLVPYFHTEARIVLTNSANHDPETRFTSVPAAEYTSMQEIARPDPSTRSEGRLRYSSSKLISMLWMYALERRLKTLRQTGKRWSVVAYSPGMTPGTGVLREESLILRGLFVYLMPLMIPVLRVLMGRSDVFSLDEAVAMLAGIAAGSGKDGEEVKSGIYYEGVKERMSSVVSYDESKQEEVWEWTVDTIAEGEGEGERSAFGFGVGV